MSLTDSTYDTRGIAGVTTEAQWKKIANDQGPMTNPTWRTHVLVIGAWSLVICISTGPGWVWRHSLPGGGAGGSPGRGFRPTNTAEIAKPGLRGSGPFFGGGLSWSPAHAAEK